MRSILNEGVVVNVNSLSNGEAIEIVSTASTQSTANVNFKMNTTEATTPNSNDWILIADNATGKIVKRMLYSNIIGGVEYTGTSPVSVNNTTNTISLSTIPVSLGGSGQTSYTDGQLLIGNTSGNTLTKATLTAGSGISIANANGSITISYDGREGQFTLSGQSLFPILASTNLIVGATSGSALYKFSVSGNSLFNGDIYVNNINIDNNDYLQFSELNLNGSNYIRLKGQDSLTSNFTLNLPAKTATIATEYTGTSPVSVNNTTSTISIDTIPVNKGGTNQTSYTDGQLLIGNTSGNTLTKANLSAGSGISIVNGNGSITIGATGVGQWTLNSGVLYPNLTSTKVVIGATAITDGFEFENTGDFKNTGNITTTALTCGNVIVQDVSNFGIRFDYYNGSSYDEGPQIKPDLIGTKEYIHINTSFMCGAINNGERMLLQSYLHNGANTTIEVPSQTSSTTITLPSTTGTLALQGEESNWTLSTSLLYPNATGTNVVIGKTSRARSNTKLEVEGNVYINGTLEMDNSQISSISQLLINDPSNNNYYTLKGAELDSNIEITLPEIAGQLLVPNSTATLGSGYTWNGVEIEADKLKIGLQLLDDNTIDYETSDNLIALKRSSNEAIRLYGTVSGSDSSAQITFYKRPTSTSESLATTIGFFDSFGAFNISPLGLRVINGSAMVSTSVPTNGGCSLYVETLSGSSTANNYVSKVRYNMSGDTTANFTNWVYNDTGSSREFYGFSYWSGSGAAADIYSLEKDGDLNILGALSESDSRVKCNIEDANLDECIDVLKSINLKKYNYTEDYIYSYNKTTEKVFGFLADDIIDNQYLGYCGKIKGMPKILNKPDGTTETINDFKTIRKSEILSVLWGVCNAQQNKIETLENEIENIKNLLINNNII